MADLQSVVQKHYDNVSSANFDAEDELFDSNVDTVDPGAGTIQGIEAFKAYERGFHQAFPDGRLTMKSAISSGNRIAVEGSFTGTHTGPLASPTGEIPPTNRTLDLAFSDIFEAEGERITRHRIYYDQVSFLAQLGLMPAPASA